MKIASVVTMIRENVNHLIQFSCTYNNIFCINIHFSYIFIIFVVNSPTFGYTIHARVLRLVTAHDNHKRSVLYGSLFYRLISYFLIVMIIPLVVLSVYYVAAGNNAITKNLSDQNEMATVRIADQVKSIIESYRHKTYVLSTNNTIISELDADAPETSSSRSKEIYEQLFTIMRGDTYLASATIVSSSGQARYSTHLFPSRYDLRYNRNDWNPFFTLSRTAGENASVITIENRYATQTNAFVFMSIYRKVRNTAGEEVGYVAVDIFQEALSSLNNWFRFNEIILIDTDNFLASSLLTTDRFGDFSNFPELRSIQAPFTRKTITDSSMIISTVSIPGTSFIVAGVTDTTVHRQGITHFFFIIIMVALLGLLVASVLAFFFTRSIAKPVNRLTSSMRKVEAGDLAVRVHESKIVEFAQLDSTFNAMVSQIAELLNLTREEEEKVREAERKALHAQMNPHFLYNTLNTVKAIAKLHGEQEILMIVTKLGRLLRESIENRETEQPLSQSIALVENYLAIQKIRFGEKLVTSIEVDPRLNDLMLPKLVIQPLVENALIHGLEPKTGTWRLAIRCSVVDSWAVITISDNGIGIPKGMLPENLEELANSEHIGLYNIYRRMQLRFNTSFSFRIDSIEGEGTEISIAVRRDREENVG